MQPGDIYFHKDFVFHDGAKADKYLVVLGTSDSHLIVAKTTSQGHQYRNDYGCQSGNRFPAFFLPLGTCCMKKNTWVCLDELYELDKTALTAKIVAGIVHGYGKITALARDIQFCAMNCIDTTTHQENIIRGSLVPA